MPRFLIALAPAAILALAAGGAPLPAAAQSDPAARALIDRLRPSVTPGATRGIRVPGETPAAAPPTAPAPVWAPPPAGTVSLPITPASPVASTVATPAAPPRPAPAPAATPRATAVVTPRPAPAPARDTTADEPSVSITVNFASGSATLTPDAERALAPLGRALSSTDLAPYRFRIEGHTDTVGDAALNQALSERRAEAVREYLLRNFGVDPSRLVSVGFGASQLLVTTPPQTAERRNRRVQVVNIGS